MGHFIEPSLFFSCLGFQFHSFPLQVKQIPYSPLRIFLSAGASLSRGQEFFALLTSAVQLSLIWCLNEAPCCDGERIVLIRPGRSPNFPNRWTGVEKEFFAKFSLFVWQTAVRRIIRKKVQEYLPRDSRMCFGKPPSFLPSQFFNCPTALTPPSHTSRESIVDLWISGTEI